MRNGPVFEVTTSFQYGKHGIEIRIWSVGQDYSQSWVRLSYGTNKYVIDSNHNNTQKQNHKSENLLIRQVSYRCTKENGLTLSHQNQLSLQTKYRRKLSVFFDRQTVQREDDGSIQFWRIKFHLRNQFSQVQHWSDERWKSCLAAGGGSKRRYQYCCDNSGRILYLRALQGHSGNNLIDPTFQDNVVIESGIFHQIYHIGCAFNLHSIINSGLIPGGQDSSRRHTVFCLPIDPRDKDHEDPEFFDFSVPRRAR